MFGVRMAGVRMAGGQRDAKWFQIRHTGDARACRFSFILCKVQWISECKKVDTNILTVGGSLCRGSLCRWVFVSWLFVPVALCVVERLLEHAVYLAMTCIVISSETLALPLGAYLHQQSLCGLLR
jgi:hypothetical protein